MSKPGVEFTAATRRAMLERDGYRCVRCGRFFPDGRGLDAHHRMLRSQGGMGTLDNGISLCGSGTTGCHGWVHAHPALSYAAGWLVHSWDDPASTPWRTWDAPPGGRAQDEPGGSRTPSPGWEDLADDPAGLERLLEWEPPE